MRRPSPQLELAFRCHRSQPKFGWGGRRRGAGRKPGPHPGVRHEKRPPFVARYPVHISIKVRGDVGPLRNSRSHRTICAALVAARREDFRVCHYSIQHHHLHLVVEANDRTALSRGMQGLMIRMARGLNRALGRTGKVFADRYFASALKTPREVRNVLAYVLCNQQRHRFGKGPGLRTAELDRYSSAATFDGWRVRPPSRSPPPDDESKVVATARTWLLSQGWRRHGLLIPAYVPQWGAQWKAGRTGG